MTTPTNAPLPDDHQFELASAYLDGELDHADRIRAQADPVVMALVADLQALQEAVDDAPPADPAVRTRAIAAALAEFDAATTGSPTGAHRAGPARRPGAATRWTRPLTLAAAAVAIVAVGVVAVQGRDRGADDFVASTASSEQIGAAAAPAGDTERSVDAGADVLMESADAPPEPAPDAAVPMDGGDATAAGSIALAAPVPEITSADTVVSSPAELTGLGRYLVGQAELGALPPSPNTRCTFAEAAAATPGLLSDESLAKSDLVEFLATGRYLLDGTEREVLVGVDRATGQAFAVDPDACTVLVEGVSP